MSERKDHIGLTQSQLSLWTGQMLSPQSPLYNMVHAFKLDGELEVAIFKKAFQKLVDNVDVLRTVFHDKRGIPYQQILDKYAFDLEVLDFTDTPKDAIETYILERSQNLFDFSKPLFDAALIKTDDNQHIWFLNVHHIITDATSSTLFQEYQSKFYDLLMSGGSETSMEIPQYAEYITFEQKAQQSNRNKDLRTYWLAKSESSSSPIQLYGEKNAKKGTKSTRVTLRLGREKTDAIKAMALKKELRQLTPDLTLFNFFLTTFFVYLYKASGERDLMIGAPLQNRITRGFKKTPGLFIEIFPLVNQMKDSDTFLTVYDRVKVETNSYLRRAQPGLMDMDISRNISIVLNYLNISFGGFANLKCDSQWIHPGHSDPGHQMRCTVYDMDAKGEFELLFDLSENVFYGDLIEKAPKQFLKILNAFLADMNMSLNDVSLVEKDEMPVDVGTIPNGLTPIMEQFELQVAKTPDAIALEHDTSQFSFKDLNERANQLAHSLVSRELEPGDTVAVYFRRSPEYIISVLACLKLGVAFVPIPANQAENRITYILKDSKSKLVITGSDVPAINDDSLDILQFHLMSFDFESGKTENLSVQTSFDSICYVLYTSGSTGTPKGVQISQKAISNYLVQAHQRYQLEVPYVFPFFTSIGFDLTVTSTFLPLINGGKLIVYPESENNDVDLALFDVIDENKVNSIKLTPSHLRLLQNKEFHASKIRRMIVGGEALRTDLASNIQRSFPTPLKIFNEYGPTEATVGCIVSQFDIAAHEKLEDVPIGQPIPGMNAFILDANQDLVTEGVVGELYLEGLGLATGYISQDAKTNEKFVSLLKLGISRAYRTGDLARKNRFGDFEYMGRIDEQIKFNGFRIELSDIETNLIKHQNITNTSVQLISRSNEKGTDKTHRLVGFYTGDLELPTQDIIDYLSTELPRYMIPTHFMFLSEMPMTPNGKLDKSKLRALDIPEIDTNEVFTAPEGEIEELVAKIWKDVLYLDKVSSQSHFISLGGNSLTALQITARINEEIEIKFSLNKVFEHPTIKQYAKHIETTLIKLLENND